MNSRQAVDQLLAMYAQYKFLTLELNQTQNQLAKAKIRKQPIDVLQRQYEDLKTQIQTVSDSMTFDTPLIWATYKFEAYADEDQPIATMQDFRLHCSKPGYICTKRYEFIEARLVKMGVSSLSDPSVYPDTTSLADAYEVLASLSEDQEFITDWRGYEYYKLNGRMAKWENYA